MSTYPLGSEVEIFQNFTDADGNPDDPTTVVFTIERPDEEVETFTSPHAQITNPSVGEWILTYTGPVAGDYLYKAAGTAGLIAVSPVGTFTLVGDAITEPRSIVGPCEPWISAFDMPCASSSDQLDQEQFALAAVETLYVLSAKRFPGTCTRTVRPCATDRCGGPWLAWNGVGWVGLRSDSQLAVPSRGCGCAPLSRIPLAGYATEITEVLIDGDVVDPDTYRLDEHRWLTRTPDPADMDERLWWPSCQNQDLPSTEEGTWEVTYEYGRPVPEGGKLAAAELACAINDSVNSGGSGECALPSGVVRIERQGITIELSALTGWAHSKDRGWQTGLPLVDTFLNAYNPKGRRRRRSTVWSPDLPRYPRPAGRMSGS